MDLIVLLLVIAIFLISYKGFRNHSFFDRYKFEVDAIQVRKEYYRLITGGFLHLGWMHLIFNMITLYLFSGAVEWQLGMAGYLLIYFGSQLGGSLLSLFIHRRHSDYSSVGASASVSGIIFAAVALAPRSHIGFFLLPFSMPAWLFGLIYVLFSIYGIRSAKDNIGHDAHLGGAMLGMLLVLLLRPQQFGENLLPILLVLLPAVVFLLLILYRPHALLVDNLFYDKHPDFYSIDHDYNRKRHLAQKEIDRILDKIGRHGIDSLSAEEKRKLSDYSNRY